jgi:LPXTG-motif cell wall-anchored protein
VNANLMDLDPGPVSGGTLLFDVTGANTTSGTGTTNASGDASFSYTGTHAGSDVITACYDQNTNGSCDPGEVFASVAATWSAPKGGTSSTSGGGDLAHTGAPTGMIAGIGAFLLVAGVATLVVLRRRRDRPAAE